MNWVWVSAFRPTYTLFLIFRLPHRFNRRASMSIRNAKHTHTHKTSFGVRCYFFLRFVPTSCMTFTILSRFVRFFFFRFHSFFSIERFIAYNKIDRIGGGEKGGETRSFKLHGKDETKTRKEKKKTHTQLDLYRVRKSMKLVREPNAKRNVLSFDLEFCLCQHKYSETRERESERKRSKKARQSLCVGTYNTITLSNYVGLFAQLFVEQSTQNIISFAVFSYQKQIFATA